MDRYFHIIPHDEYWKRETEKTIMTKLQDFFKLACLKKRKSKLTVMVIRRGMMK
jgi:hypothetical protein